MWIGTHPLDIGLYLFDCKREFQELAGFGRQCGVMGEEVEAFGFKGRGHAFGELRASELRGAGHTLLRVPVPLTLSAKSVIS